jgi:AraC family transcriptional regulator
VEPRIVRRSGFVVVGMKYRGKSEKNEIPQLWEKFMPRVGEIKQRANRYGLGVMDNYDEKTGEFDYLAGVEVEEASDIPQGMESWQVPEQTYAVFFLQPEKHQGSVSADLSSMAAAVRVPANPGAEFRVL